MPPKTTAKKLLEVLKKIGDQEEAIDQAKQIFEEEGNLVYSDATIKQLAKLMKDKDES
jgi:predicted transcriptional regulator